MSLEKAINNKIKGVKNAVVGVASDVMSAPSRAMSAIKSANATSDYTTLKNARNSKGAPQFDNKGAPTDAFKYQTAADTVLSKRLKK